jgi:transposase
LLFQPPYSPDVNPIERVWQFMKDKLRWLNLKNSEELRGKIGFNEVSRGSHKM